MTEYEIISLTLTSIALLGIPVFVLLIRGAVKWTQTSIDLRNLISEVKRQNSEDKKVHVAMYDQMSRDRRITDKRLRYLEEIWIRKGMSPGSIHIHDDPGRDDT